ncbi:transcriptional regulator [Sulfolobus islandicus L.S.2.15]|uniref:Transcriptional regulator n=1 Tax=Saccharolobus islandicus (strain L.S.2.15 / Lassen \|nr:transcriptional regulator [Sulfolobus islandicus]ACP35095.1 transcriptional regulator [Sulfolobus islandicus L.S.2.15]
MVLEGTKKLVILVLGLAGGYLTTDTRFQKLAFLVNQEVFNLAKFEPNDYGPYSKELMRAVDELEKEGKLVYKWDSDGVSRYYLTEKGKEEFQQMLNQFGKEKVDKAKEIIQEHKDDPLSYLIAYVYKKYPEYAKNSKIKDKVEEWIRYYHL